MENLMQTSGRVVAVKKCWWMKVNTKPVRKDLMDGAAFAHMIKVSYQAQGQTFEKWKYVNWDLRCPQFGDTVEVHYDARRPKKAQILIK